MPSNTPMTAAQLLALADRIASAAFHDGYFAHEIDDNNICAIQAAAEAYRAARAASPRTLEEVLMAEEVRASREYDRIISSDPLPCYEVCRAAEDGWRFAKSQREGHARRLAGEGGGK